MFLLSIFAVDPLFAQTPSISERLPQSTLFYMQWRGKSFLGDADKKNHVIQLIEDPDFEPVRQALAKNFLQWQQKNGSAAPTLQLADLISLLDNPAAFGFIAGPQTSGVGPSNPSHLASLFFVYDATGKAELVLKLKALAQANSKTKPAISTYTFGSSTIEVRTENPNDAANPNTTYSTRAGNYFLVTTQKDAIEDLVIRFSSAAKPNSSVMDLPEYQAIRPYIGKDAAVEYFVHLPDPDKWIPAGQKDQPMAKFIRSVHLEKIHVAGGGISFAGEATRAHGAILGDTSAGSLFDIAGPSTAIFQTQPIVDTGAYFSISKFDFASLYQTVRTGAVAAMTPQQSAGLLGAEAMAQGFLGMSVSDALQLFTGEFGDRISFAEDGESQQLYALTIQKPQDVLRLLRAAFAKMIAAEDTSGDTTYLDFSYPFKDPETGQQRRSSYYVAVTPKFIIMGPRKAMVRGAVARIGGKATAAAASPDSVITDPEFARLRSLLPEKLSGIGGSNLARIPWDKIIARFIEQMESAKQSNQNNPPTAELLRLIKPGLVNRHLKASANGWWKDSGGIYFDYYIQ
ncbi:MAG: hypothetical protein WCD49_16505 [Candidatus Acidiferrales bacterium]